MVSWPSASPIAAVSVRMLRQRRMHNSPRACGIWRVKAMLSASPSRSSVWIPWKGSQESVSDDRRRPRPSPQASGRTARAPSAAPSAPDGWGSAEPAKRQGEKASGRKPGRDRDGPHQSRRVPGDPAADAADASWRIRGGGCQRIPPRSAGPRGEGTPPSEIGTSAIIDGEPPLQVQSAGATLG